MKTIRLIIYMLLQWTWGIVQNLCGLVFFIALNKVRVENFHGAVCVTYTAKEKSRLGCFTLGSFIFMRDNTSRKNFPLVVVHEYGHTIQSIIFGPLYLPVIGLPSILWASTYDRTPHAPYVKREPYTSRFPENNASRLGEKITKCKAMDW